MWLEPNSESKEHFMAIVMHIMYNEIEAVKKPILFLVRTVCIWIGGFIHFYYFACLLSYANTEKMGILIIDLWDEDRGLWKNLGEKVSIFVLLHF